MSHRRPDILQVFSDPALGWLLDRMVARLQKGEPLRGVVRKSAATYVERRAVDDLLGRPSRPGGSLSLDLGLLDEKFDLEWIVREIKGPITNLRASQKAETEAW